MAGNIDVHIGARIRRRRRLLGLTQQLLSEAVDTSFQQIQKYECGANRLTAGRLYQISLALGVPTTYFFEGLSGSTASNDSNPVTNEELVAVSALVNEETIELIRVFCELGERPRRRLLDLANALQTQNVA